MTEVTTAPTPAKARITETQYLKADGSEADSPLDNAVKLNFKLVEAGRDWTLDLTEAVAGMQAAGVNGAAVNALVAYAGFGAKTKWNNLANSVRNGKQKGTDEAGPAAQAAAIDDFIEDVLKGNWRGEAGEGLVTGTADLAEAIKRVQVTLGKVDGDVAKIKALLDAMTKEERAERRNNPNVKAKLDEIRAERSREKAAAAGAANTEALLSM